MCMMSVVHQYVQDRVPSWTWTDNSYSDFKEILKQIEALDKKLGQPDCVDPKKAAWMKAVEERLAALEHPEP